MAKLSNFNAIALCLLIIGVIALVYFTRPPRQITLHSPNGQKIKAEIADNDASRKKGLSDRESLATNSGLLFIYPQPDKHCIWMKGMRFALDVIWLDENKEVIYIVKEIPADSYPQTFCPDKPAKYVLEINSGKAKEFGISETVQLFW